MSKYAPLTDFLNQQNATRLQLTFGQIEEIIGEKLPRSARTYRPWWGNETAAESRQCRSWTCTGWRVESVDQAHGRVTFSNETVPRGGMGT